MVDYKGIASTLVERQLRIREGEVVRISGGIHTVEFIEEIALKVRQRGAFPLIFMGWDSLYRRSVNETPIRFLETPPEVHAKLEGLIDCNISLPGARDPRVSATIDPEKARTLTRASRIVAEASFRKRARRIGVGFPTPEQARVYDVDFEKYNSLFWSAVSADVDQIFDLCQIVRERLRKGRGVQVISPDGSKLSFSIEGRRINMDDGVISNEDLESGDITANLPFGEVYLAPVEETVEGDVVYPVAFHNGKRIEELRLFFEGGELVRSEAKSNHELFLEAMKGHTGDKKRIGELGIGTNHQVHEPMGNVLLDEKIFGSVHLALGENRSYGGKNQSSCHWDMVLLSPTLLIDGEPLLEAGKFMI